MNSLGRVDFQPPEDINLGTKQLEVLQDALRTVTGSGLVFPDAPQGYTGDMPRDLTTLDDGKLGDLLNSLSAWCSFADSELAKADAARSEAKARLEFVRSRIRLMIKMDPEQKKLTNPDKDDIVTTDPRVVAATGRSLYCEAVYTLTRAIRERAQRNWETVSRRITQRGQEVDRMRREGNVGNTPTSSRAFRR
jgi:hypothetical protein